MCTYITIVIFVFIRNRCPSENNLENVHWNLWWAFMYLINDKEMLENIE